MAKEVLGRVFQVQKNIFDPKSQIKSIKKGLFDMNIVKICLFKCFDLYLMKIKVFPY